MNLYKGIKHSTVEVTNEQDMDRAIEDLAVISGLHRAAIQINLPSVGFIPIFMSNMNHYFLENQIPKTKGDITLLISVNSFSDTEEEDNDTDKEMDA